jgi:DNA-directed RNA polymerase subunit RPC12/RpoP
MSEPIDTQRNPQPVCPHCGAPERDAWEIDFGAGMEGETEIECGNCSEEYVAAREVSVTYSTRKVSKQQAQL